MDITSLTPEALKLLAAEQLQDKLKRLTPAQRKGLKADQVAAVMETLDPAFRLTLEEQQRRDAARQLADADGWRAFVASCLVLIRESYDDGEVTLEGAIEGVGRIAIGCWPQDRVRHLGVMAALLLQRRPTPRAIGQTRPAYPKWMKRGTADLAVLLQERQPKKRLTPGSSNRTGYDPSSPLIVETLEILTILRWFGDQPTPRPSTIDDWVRERKRERGAPAIA